MLPIAAAVTAMLEGRVALDFALELTRSPTLVSAMRAQALPVDTLVVIRIAAGCEETTRAAGRETGLPPHALSEACVHYLQRVLFAPDADCYRVLGVSPGASRSQMRQHMRWLIQWLHPDRNPNEWESIFAERVLSAWREATKAGAVADAKTHVPGPVLSSVRPRRVRQRWIAVPLETKRRRWVRPLALVAAMIGAVGLALAVLPPIQSLSGLATP